MLSGTALLKDILSGLPGAFFLLGPDRRVLWHNDEAAGIVLHLFGREITPGVLMDELSSPDSLEDFRKYFAEALEGRPRVTQRDIRYVQGITRLWTVIYLPIRETSGTVTGVLFGGFLVESADAVRARMLLFERSVASVGVGVTLADARDPELPLTFVNPAFERITGYTSSECLGRNCRFLQGTDREQPGVTALREALRERRPEHVVLRNYRKDGTLFWNSVSVSPIFDEQGQLTHFLGVQQDVTELYESQARLARVVRMEAAGQLAAGIAHDVNNLLTVVQMNVTMLAESPDPTAREIAADLETLATRGHGVIRRLLDFARADTREPVALELGGFLVRVDHLVRPLLGNDITLVMLPPDEPLTVHVDPASLEQVLVNLVINARHAMPHGGTLRVAVEHRAGGLGGPRAVIAVSDTGIGMSEEVMRKLFEPFFTTRAGSGGTGLGLTTSRRLLREVGGDLEVESELGQGSTFRLVLPLVPGSARAAPPAAPSPQALNGTETLLVADDEPAVRRWMARALARCGYNVIEASDGEEALALIARARPQLVICDTVMPRLGARGVLAALARQPHAPPVIVTSGYGPGMLDNLAERPAALLTKSFTLTQLTRCVRDVLDRASARPS
jgi:PAS domain S-box-containing protein